MVFIDANILLEVLLPNRIKADQVANLLSELDQPTAISTLTAHLIMYFGRLRKIPDDTLHAAISRYNLLPLINEDYHWATVHESGKDFEDALQVSVALRAGCTHFMTLDRPLAKNYQKQPLEFLIPQAIGKR